MSVYRYSMTVALLSAIQEPLVLAANVNLNFAFQACLVTHLIRKSAFF